MHRMRSVLVAYSGGVDSSYLAYVATQEIGGNALCVTGLSPSVSAYQRDMAHAVANVLGLNHITITTKELDLAGYTANSPDRCFFCKDELYTKLGELARARSIAHMFDGTNHDDLGDHRPGRKAAEVHGVRSPLAEVGMTKSEVRERSQAHGLATWDKPASPCLSSRIAYGTAVTIGRLAKVERGEELLREAGFREFRVRMHGDLARIEIAGEEIHRAFEAEMLNRLNERFREIGFSYVTLDLQGFRSGSMNEVLK